MNLSINEVQYHLKALTHFHWRGIPALNLIFAKDDIAPLNLVFIWGRYSSCSGHIFDKVLPQ